MADPNVNTNIPPKDSSNDVLGDSNNFATGNDAKINPPDEYFLNEQQQNPTNNLLNPDEENAKSIYYPN